MLNIRKNLYKELLLVLLKTLKVLQIFFIIDNLLISLEKSLIHVSTVIIF